MDDDFFGAPVPRRNELDEVIVPQNISPKASAGEKILVAAPAPPPPVFAAAAPAPPAAGAQLYQDQLKAVADRTAQIDQSTRDRDERQRKQAQAYLSEQIALRDSRLKAVKAEHVKEQQELQQKVLELKKSGAVWQSVGLLVDLQKPNTHSKRTEQMRSILKKLAH
jgi:hypothetical protein